VTAPRIGTVGRVRPFRFGFQSTSTTPQEVVGAARAAEDAGFDIFQVGDHVGAEPSALVCLTAAAVTTERIRLGTLVLNNDLHHPVTLAQEVATLDQLSNGRLEVGLGAGHSFTEYAAMGQPFDPPAVRKARLADSVEILRALLDGGPVSRRGAHYRIEGAVTLAPRQEHVPLLVGVNGRTALAHAVRHADIVAPTMLGRTREDGQHHDVRWEASRLDATVEWMRHEAGGRWDGIELHALVQAVVITDDRTRVVSEIAGRIGMDVADAACTPFLCIGTHAEIARHLLACRERWGFSYYSVRDIDAFSPVLVLLR
jgi:probable F420-dependent oxidoreductase